MANSFQARSKDVPRTFIMRHSLAEKCARSNSLYCTFLNRRISASPELELSAEAICRKYFIVNYCKSHFQCFIALQLVCNCCHCCVRLHYGETLSSPPPVNPLLARVKGVGSEVSCMFIRVTREKRNGSSKGKQKSPPKMGHCFCLPVDAGAAWTTAVALCLRLTC